MDLLIEPSVAFEKLGGEVTLPEDPNAWPIEITQELFKQVPYIADFEPHVVMDKVDGERGYGFGHVEVMNKTEIQQGASPEGVAAAGVRTTRIPVIIKDRKLQPFDVLVTEDSTMLPLTEARLRQAIFRPQNFDITARTPGDMSMIGQLYPPSRQNYGMSGGSGAAMDAGMGKTGAAKLAGLTAQMGAAAALRAGHPSHAQFQVLSKNLARKVTPGQVLGGLGGAALGGAWIRKDYKAAKEKQQLATNPGMGKQGKAKEASLLEAIAPTITAGDYSRFYDELANDGLRAAYVKNASATLPSLRTLGACTPVDDEKVASSLLEDLKPSVVQLVRDVEGYTIKTANHRAWAVKTLPWDRVTALEALGEKVVLAADLAGSATMTLGEGAAPPEGPEEQGGEPIKDFGVYKVRDQQGAELTGHVFPNLLDVDGALLPLALFWNGEKSAVQGGVVGELTGEDVPLAEGQPQGRGAFYDLAGEEPVATIPLTIRAVLGEGPDAAGVSLMAETFDGREVSVLIQPNLAKVMSGGEGEMLIPDTMKWLPLEGTENVALLGEPETAEKMAHPTRALASVLIRAGGVECFSIDGIPVMKLAAEDRSFLSTDDAMFLLAGLGVRPSHAAEKLASALDGSRPIEVKIGRSLVLARDAWEDASKHAAARVANLPVLQAYLVKEAAVLPDPTAVDTVLSLGFINPENTTTFLNYLPQIEESQKKMCELLVAARLGLQQIPTPALEKAVRTTEQVLEGLKVLAFQSN